MTAFTPGLGVQRQALSTGFALALLVESAGIGAAQNLHHAKPSEPGALFANPRAHGSPVGSPVSSAFDPEQFGQSGTRGRMGLGADPTYPEGPGNVSE